MRAIGLFRELTNKAEAPSVLDSADRLGPEQVALVASYLADGEALLDSMEASPNPFVPGASIPGGSGMVATSRFVFRQDLRVLVERYRVAVDDDVLAAATSGERLLPEQRAELHRQIPALFKLLQGGAVKLRGELPAQ